MTEELTRIADELAELLPLFHDGSEGLFLPTKHAATSKGLAIDAKSVLDEELGRANDYSLNLVHAVNSGAGGFLPGPSYASVEEAAQIVRAGAKACERKRLRVAAPTGSKSYVDPARITALTTLKDAKWDFVRLLELCREINVAAANRCHMSTAMLLRSILNHVPPVFGFGTFAEVANNHSSAGPQKSLKKSLQRLEGSLRNIADMHLHTPIRQREDIPTFVQVDFAADLDVLLGEIIRIAREV